VQECVARLEHIFLVEHGGWSFQDGKDLMVQWRKINKFFLRKAPEFFHGSENISFVCNFLE